MNRRELLTALGLALPGALMAVTGPTEASAGEDLYRGNKETKVFHKPNCRYYGCGDCTKPFKTRDEASQAGYRPCGVCKP